MKILNCVISYNRYFELKNLIRSIEMFSDLNHTVIVDDGSSDERLQSYLKELESQGAAVICHQPWDHKEYHTFGHNGLYENMDEGVQFAIDHQYDYIHFLHDDMQFIRDAVKAYADLDQLFIDIEDMSQLSVLLPTKEYLTKKSISPERIAKNAMWWMRPHGMLDLGIVPVKLLKDNKYRFGNGDERTNSGWWRRKGYNVYALHNPLVTVIPGASKFFQGKKVREGHLIVQGSLKLAPMTIKLDDGLEHSFNKISVYEDHY